MGRKVPLIITGSFGAGAFLIPMSMSAIYNALNFRVTLDILGVLFTINSKVFTLHAARNNWGIQQTKSRSKGEEDQEDLLQKNNI